MRTKIKMVVAAMAVLVGSQALANEWEVDPAHSSAQFAVKHMMVSTVRGQFENMSGAVTLDDKDPTKMKIAITIDANSINTRNAKRDAHLKSPDFFDVAKYPNITFVSTKTEKSGDGKLKVTGDLTMHGVTHPVTLTVDPLAPAIKDVMGKMRRGVAATGKLNRKDWGPNWNKALEAGGVVVSDEVDLQIDAELVPKAGAGASAKK